MGDAGPVIAAIITTLGGLITLYFGSRRYARRAEGGNSVGKRWREEAELWQARAERNADDRDAEKAGRLATEQALATTRHDLDDCERQLDGARSDLRALERRRRTTTP